MMSEQSVVTAIVIAALRFVPPETDEKNVSDNQRRQHQRLHTSGTD